MNQEAVEAKDEEVTDALDRYATCLKAMDTDGAGEAAEALAEMECGVCQRLGHHLTALVVALSTAPGPERESALRETAIETAEELENDLV